jgi:dihydroflavonol-4-reductase
MKKIVVTGSTGFIGSHLVIQALNEGNEVVATMRDMKRADAIKKVFARHTDKLEHLSFSELDLLRDEGWEETFKGVDYVIHMASPVPTALPKHENDVIEPARQGTMRALKAASKNGVKRIVITSSMGAIMYGYEGKKTVFSEEDWTILEGKDNSAYTKSKTIAEKAAWDFIEKDNSGLQLVAVNPGMVFGPVLESDIGPSNTIIKKLLEGAFPGTPKLGWEIADVRDVVQMHLLAMTTPAAAGHRFFCGNGFMWMNDIARVLKEKMPEYSKKVPTKNLPVWLMRILAKFDKEVRTVAFELNMKHEASNSKARDILGWQPRNNEDAILDTGRSLIDIGAVKL